MHRWQRYQIDLPVQVVPPTESPGGVRGGAEPIPLQTATILQNQRKVKKMAAAIFCMIRVCKPLSLVMSLRDLPMTSMDFENGRHETLPSSHQEIPAAFPNRFGPLYPGRRLRPNYPRFNLDEAGLQARHIAVLIGRGRPDKNLIHNLGQYHLCLYHSF